MKKLYVIAAVIFAFLMVTSTNAFAASSRSGSSDIGVSGSTSRSSSQDLGGSSNPASSSPNSADSLSSSNSRDSSGLSSSSQFITVTIKPNPAYVGQVVNFIVYVNNRSKDFTLFFMWEYGDGDSFSGSETGMGVPFWFNTTHSYSKVGSYTVKLSVRDKDGKQIYNYSSKVDVLTIFFSIDAGGPYSGKVGEKILFGGSTIDAQSGVIAAYNWDFGDGYSYSGSSARHVYSTPGIYTATLSAQDQNGNVFTDCAMVVIGKLSVVIHPSNPTVNEEVIFCVEVLGFIPTGYFWDFGDRSTGYGQSTTHVYTEAKTYYGKICISAPKINDLYADFVVTVSPNTQQNTKPVPIFTVSPADGDSSTLFEFDTSDSYDTSGKIISYEWYFGDGSLLLTTNPKCNYIYDESGDWTVTCVVGNNLGEYNFVTKTVEVISEENGGSGVLTLGTEDIGPSPKTSTASLEDQDGLLFFAGSIKKDDSGDSSGIGAAAVGKQCDLDISVSLSPSKPDSGKPIVFHVTVTDRLGNNDASGVNIKLDSDIKGYDNVNYYARWNPGSKKYFVDISISWPNDAKPYAVTLTATPNNGFNEIDWHGNRWSEVLSGKLTDSDTNLIAIIPNYKGYIGALAWGSFAL